jgi:hypothetical protein
MISVFYTGDRRHNPVIMRDNHDRILQALSRLAPVEVAWFTKDFAHRGQCPFDEGGADMHLRRGQGGAVQVWDFITGVERLTGDIRIKFRTDLWFTDSACAVIVDHVRDIMKGHIDVVYFGSDLINQNHGKENESYEITRHDPARIQDFIVAVRPGALKHSQDVISSMLDMAPKKVRSGNKVFRNILREDARARGVMCHVWLIRKWYESRPTDRDVCLDYIRSYMDQAKNEFLDVLDPAWAWWATYQC